MRRMPFRPDNEISQVYNSGVLTVLRMEDQAAPGYAPDAVPGEKAVLRYEEQRMGLQRYYAAREVHVRVDRVVRVPARMPISPEDRVETIDGKKYRVELVQAVPGVFPPSLDLTLSRLTQDYDGEEGGNAVV